VATPKLAAQAIKKLAEIGWKPLHTLSYVPASIGSVIKPARSDKRPGHHLGGVLQGSERSQLEGR
jgi:branched-chain amino acid transport system substrate-binding protein